MKQTPKLILSLVVLAALGVIAYKFWVAPSFSLRQFSITGTNGEKILTQADISCIQKEPNTSPPLMGFNLLEAGAQNLINYSKSNLQGFLNVMTCGKAQQIRIESEFQGSTIRLLVDDSCALLLAKKLVACP